MSIEVSKSESVFVAGHRGLVGSAIVRHLRAEGYSQILVRTRDELNLLDQAAVHAFFRQFQPKYVYLAAARVGGIFANNAFQADFLYENLIIAANVIHAAHETKTEKLLFLGSSCIYPKFAPQPIPENSLLTGPLESTNEGYALAKIAGLKLCEMYRRQYNRRFISAMPTNLYGQNDNFHPLNSHVIPGMLRRFHEAKNAGRQEVTVWGTGTPKREFLHVDDLARALEVLMQVYEDPTTINVGSGEEVTIRGLTEVISSVTGFAGGIAFDSTKPDGTPRKIMDSTRMRALGWSPKFTLAQGLTRTYEWCVANGVFN